MNRTTVSVNLSRLLSSLPSAVNPFPCMTMPETFPAFHGNYSGLDFGDTHISTMYDCAMVNIQYTYNGTEYSLTLDAIDYDEHAPEEYKFVQPPHALPNMYFAWVPDESTMRELVPLFIAREIMLGMEN